jgi:hypothetical protein
MPDTRTVRRSIKSIIAATYCCDVSDVGDHYQRERGVYVMGDNYLTCSPTRPTDGREWMQHPDQFWAERSGTVLWVF